MPEIARRSRHRKAPDCGLRQHNLIVEGRRTSIRLDATTWRALQQIADRESRTVHQICTSIAWKKSAGLSLTVAIRIYVMRHFQAAATEEGHLRAGHGRLWRTALRFKIAV